MKRLSSTIGLLLLGACGGSDPAPDPCLDVEGTCVGIAPGADRAEIQEALIEIESGATLAFSRGTYDIDGELSLDVDGVTIKGDGMDSTILSFAGQTTGAQGMLVTADDFTIRDLGLEDSPGDLLKIEGANGVTIQRVRAEWTNGPDPENGAYALYPVQCANVLIEDSVAIASSDAGVYVGQSDNIVVRGNRAELNVAGIEIENSTRADVFENEAVNNTGGILVFNLPGLDVANGAGTRVFDNNIHDNNTENFAPPGNIVGKVPTGTGLAILAAHQVEVFDNVIENHLSVNLGIISYTSTDIAFDDPEYDPDPDTIEIHGNTFRGTSDMPTGELGALLILGMTEILGGAAVVVPDIVWDGVVPAAKADPGDPEKLMDAINICIHDNGDADFANLHWPNTELPEADTDSTDHDCDHEPLPEVVLE
jgi:parallel beta-helix repeat protein